MRSEPSGVYQSSGGFEIVDHTADWALRVYGSDLADLLKYAAVGMTSLLVGEPAIIPMDVERDLMLDAFDAETLLVDWLSELAYLAEEEQLVFREFQFKNVTRTHLEAHIYGGRVEGLQKHIKAVTYHNLSIDSTKSGLTATIVLDV